MKARTFAVGLAVLFGVAVWVGGANVAEARSRFQEPASPSDNVPVKKIARQAPTQSPVQSPVQSPAQAPVKTWKQAPVQAPIQAPSKGCAAPCIKYHHHCTLRKTCSPCETYETVLNVTDPCCCGCDVQIPICLPCGCKDSPAVCSRTGHHGRCVVTYEWCCGYKVKVVINRCGDVAVHSYGR